jgi:hypothetical protein
MAANTYKTEIANMAVTILRQGKVSDAGQFFDSIDDTEFADYTTVTGTASQDKQRVCFVYEAILKEVLRDIQPDFAIQYADLAEEIRINKEMASHSLLFELPTNYLDIVDQISQADRSVKYDNEILTFDSYAHVVVGTDDQAWKCIVAHTAADANKPITGASYATYWELYDTDSAYGAAWVANWAYKASESGLLLATSDYSNTAGDSVYIKYLAYVQAGISDKPQFYSPEFKRAVAVRLASALTKDVEKQKELIARYGMYEKPEAWDNKDRKRFKGNRVVHGSVITARRNLSLGD